MKKNNQIFIIALLFGSLFSNFSYGQFGVSVGPAVLKPFGSPTALVGIHFGGEYSEDNNSSYFGRVSIYSKGDNAGVFSAALIDNVNNTFSSETLYTTTSSVRTIEGGLRYYLVDGYETGFAVYGGSIISLNFTSIRADFRPYDEVQFRLEDGFAERGALFGFGFGLQGGVKYGLPGLGTIFFDTGLTMLLTSNASNFIAQNSLDYFKNISFGFNLGFRKDLFTGGF